MQFTEAEVEEVMMGMTPKQIEVVHFLIFGAVHEVEKEVTKLFGEYKDYVHDACMETLKQKASPNN